MAATLMICGSFFFSSCIGSFGLSGRLLSWNKSISDKFVNELVFLCLTPIYGVTLAADYLVINAIEFWSGSNPMASVGDIRKVKGENADYLVETLKNGYSITKEGETEGFQLLYNEELNSWNVVADGVSTELFQFDNEGMAQITLPAGEKMSVSIDAQGVAAARRALTTDCYYAAR